MATKLFVKKFANSGPSLTSYFYTNTVAALGGSTNSVTTATASGTNIQCTKTAGGTALAWVSQPFSATATISGDITVNTRAKESGAAVNSKMRCRVYILSAGVETQFGSGDASAELTTSDAAQNFTITPTSQAFAIGDRLVIKFFVTNAGTMAAGTVTMTYGGATGAAAGDTYISLTENVTFTTEPEYLSISANSGSGTSGTLGVSGVIANNLMVLRSEVLLGVITITGITDSQSNTWAKYSGPTSANGVYNNEAWYAVATGTGTNTLTINFSSSATWGGDVVMYGNCATASVLDATATAASGTTGAPTSNAVTTISSYAVVITSMDENKAGAASSGNAAYIGRATSDGGGYCVFTDRYVQATGAYSNNWSVDDATNTGWSAFCAAFKDVNQPAVGGARVPKMMLLGVS